MYTKASFAIIHHSSALLSRAISSRERLKPWITNTHRAKLSAYSCTGSTPRKWTTPSSVISTKLSLPMQSPPPNTIRSFTSAITHPTPQYAATLPTYGSLLRRSWLQNCRISPWTRLKSYGFIALIGFPLLVANTSINIRGKVARCADL